MDLIKRILSSDGVVPSLAQLDILSDALITLAFLTFLFGIVYI